mgnify:CR=1 FL=1
MKANRREAEELKAEEETYLWYTPLAWQKATPATSWRKKKRHLGSARRDLLFRANPGLPPPPLPPPPALLRCLLFTRDTMLVQGKQFKANSSRPTQLKADS